MSDLHPFTGFGDDTNSSVKFTPLLGRNGFPDWEGGDPRMEQRPIVLSSRTNTQVWGYDPYVITIHVEFANRTAVDLMRAVRGTRATLRYIDGITTRIDGAVVPGLGGVKYLTFPDTLLLKMAGVVNVVDDIWEADLTFQRAATGDSYVGFSSTGEDDE